MSKLKQSLLIIALLKVTLLPNLIKAEESSGTPDLNAQHDCLKAMGFVNSRGELLDFNKHPTGVRFDIKDGMVIAKEHGNERSTDPNTKARNKINEIFMQIGVDEKRKRVEIKDRTNIDLASPNYKAISACLLIENTAIKAVVNAKIVVVKDSLISELCKNPLSYAAGFIISKICFRNNSSNVGAAAISGVPYINSVTPHSNSTNEILEETPPNDQSNQTPSGQHGIKR